VEENVILLSEPSPLTNQAKLAPLGPSEPTPPRQINQDQSSILHEHPSFLKNDHSLHDLLKDFQPQRDPQNVNSYQRKMKEIE
jgi:hypothetical protein